MKCLLTRGWLAAACATAFFFSTPTPPARAQDAGPPPADPALAAGEDDELIGGLSAPAMQRLSSTQRTMAALMRQANQALNNGESPDAVAKQFYAELAKLRLEAPMVELNRLKTRLGEVGLADAALGEKFDGGGTPVEKALLVYRREVTMDSIRAAVAEVARTYGADATGKVFLAKIGKWSVQDPNMFTLAGDIDFSFMGARPEIIIALRDAYVRIIQDRMKMSMVAFDSVATAHGFAEHMVYMGIQGRKFADDAMMGMNQGVEQLDFRNPDSVGTPRARQLTGAQALNETVLEETAIRYREEGHEARSRTLAGEIEKTWNDRRGQSVEPMLSMEMARHLEHDIIRNADVFTAIDVIKKGSKYLRRSNDQTTADLGIAAADPAWAKFVEQVDELAKKATTQEMIDFIDPELKKLGEPGLFREKIVDGKPVGYEPHPGGAERFLALMKEMIWKNVSNGLDVRIRTLGDAINLRGRAAGPGTPDDLRPERIADTIRMLAVGLEVMQRDHSRIPPDVIAKAGLLTKYVETYARQRAFALPDADLEKIRQLLTEAAAHENSRLLKLGAVVSHIDSWMVRQYDTLAATMPESVRSGVTAADAKIDAFNSVLDFLDNTTLGALRDSGVLALDMSAESNLGIVGWKTRDGERPVVHVAEFPRIAAINQKLNQTILGRIGNNTAFKAFNLAQEGDAYYAALMDASTPGEAFQNLATEIFRRRVPGGGAVEAAVMGNYLRASVEVVYLLFPPLAVPEGLYGIAMSVSDKYDAWYWSSELERYVDGFYAGAEFELVTPAPAGQARRFRLTGIKITHASGWAKYDRASIEAGTAAMLTSADVDKTLWENLARPDPFIQLMEELKKHEAAGEKVRAHFQRQIEEHWAKVRADFGKNLIARFEDRKASETAIDLGEVPTLYGELIKVADELDINEALHAAMDKDWNSDYLQRLWVWLKATKRDTFSEAAPEAEATRAVTILRKYLEAYRKVVAARTATESALDAIFTDAGLEPPPHERDGRRVLTRTVFLRCDPAQDAALAARLQAAPAATLAQVRAQFDAIIEEQAPGAKRDEDFDSEMAAKITGELFWITALRSTQVAVILKATLDRAVAAHAEASDKLFAEFTAHYVAQTGALAVRVRQWIDAAASEQPVTGATLALADADGRAVAGAAFRDLGDGRYRALGIKPGRYTLTVSAPGFAARSGEKSEKIVLAVTDDKASREAEVFLKATAEGEELGVTITASLDPALLYTRGETTSLDLQATVAAKKDSGAIVHQWSLGDQVLLQGERETRLSFSAVGKAPGDIEVALYVRDEKLREGTAKVTIRIVDGQPLEVVFGEHAAEIFKDEDAALAVVQPQPGPGLGLHYAWVFKDAAGTQVFAQDGENLHTQSIAGRNFAGQTLTVSVIVRDRDGRTGTAATTLAVRDEESPEELPVSIEPASGTLKVGDRLTLQASATAFGDSGAIEFSWDDGRTWSADRSAAEIVGEPADIGALQSITVMARDRRGRRGEATAGIRVERKFDDSKVVGDDDEFEIGVDGPATIEEGATIAVKALMPKLSAKRLAELTLVWFDQTGGREIGRGPSAQFKPPQPGEYTLTVAARERPESYGSTYGFGSHSYLVLPVSPVPLQLQTDKALYVLGEQGTVYATIEANWLAWGKRRYAWQGAAGNKESAQFTADKEGESEIGVEVFATVGPVERSVARGTIKVLAAAQKLELPREIMATDLFTVTAKVPPAVAARATGYRWSGGATVDPETREWTYWGRTPLGAEVQMQIHPEYFNVRDKPPEDPTTTIGVELVDAEGRSVFSLSGTTVLKPACFTGSMSGAWEGGPWYGGFHARRQPQKSAILHDENGRAYSSASAWAEVDAKWGRYGDDPEPDFRASAAEKKWEVTSFAIDDFKGFVAVEPEVRWYRGSGGWLTGYTSSGASRTGYGFVRKGGAVISLNFTAASSGSWDNSDEAWQRSQVAALFGEAQGLLAGLTIDPDPKFEHTAYDGPALDGSDEILPLAVALEGGPSGGKLPFGQTADIAAKVTGGKAPFEYAWSGDHAGSGATVTIAAGGPGPQNLSVTVTSADGQTASASYEYTVDKVTGTISGLDAPVVYGTKRTVSLAVQGADAGKVRVIWQSSPGLTFDPPESPAGATATVTIDRAPSEGIEVWAQLTGENGGTIGEAAAVTVKVEPPKFALKTGETSPRVGREVPVTIAVTPAIEPGLLDFRWIEPATAQRREVNDNASEIVVTTRDTKPLALLAHARAPGSGDELGEIAGTITAQPYTLKAVVVEPANKPMVWKEGRGLVPVERGTYAGDEIVTVAADFDGDRPEGEVRWSWTANDGTSIGNNSSRTPSVSRHETGTAALDVTARDKDNTVLGTASVSFSVTVPAAEIQKALQPEVTLRTDRADPVTNEPLTFTAEVVRGTAPYRYAWTGIQGTATTATVTPAKPGRVSVSVTVTDAKGKTASASLEREVKLSERDRARQEAERLAGVAREAARRGDFDAAVKAIEDARRADPSIPELVKTVTREVVDAANKAGAAAEAKRDFAASGRLFGAAAKLDPQDATAARGVANAKALQAKLDELRTAQKELEATLARQDLDAATAQLEKVQAADAALPGTTSAETTVLAAKVQQALATYTREVGAQKKAIETDKTAKRFKEAKTRLTALTQRPLRRDDAAWAKALAAELDKLIAAEDARKPDKPGEKKPDGTTPDSPADASAPGAAPTTGSPTSATSAPGAPPIAAAPQTPSSGVRPMPTPANAAAIQGSPAPLAGTWNVNFNGYTGTLTLAPDGRATLDLGSGVETLTDVRYDSATHEITFTRPLGGAGSGQRQVYAGRLTREGFAEGTFDCTVSGSGFRWWTQQTAKAPGAPSPAPAAGASISAGLGGTPIFAGQLGTRWDGLSAAGGDFGRFARFEGGALVVDVPAGHGWGKTGMFSREPSLTVGPQPTSVIVRLDPARTTGFGVAFASTPHPDVWVLHNVWFSWVRTPAGVQADLWFGNTQNGSDGRVIEQIAPAAPAELVFTFQPGRASVLLPDGRTRTVDIGWLREGTPLFTHVFAHPTDSNRPAKAAFTGLEVAAGAPATPPAPPASATTQGARVPVGELGTVWEKLSAAGGDFDRFARFEGGALVVDVPAGNSWGKTGIFSRERLLTLGAQPVHITARFDPARTTGLCVAFAASPHPDVWVLHNVWFSWTRPAAAAQAGIWFGNTQNASDGSLSELLAPTPPGELTFTLQPGRASVRLPDGKTRTVDIGWLKEGTPIFADVFSHPSDAGRPARLALTGFDVVVGAAPPAAAAPTVLDSASTRLAVGAPGEVWEKLSAAGGDFDRFARFDGAALVVDVPAGNSWGKTGIFSRERLFTLGQQPVSVAVMIDPARTTGFCVAFAPTPHPDVWVIQNAWLTWTVPPEAKEADFSFLDTQNGADGQVTGKLPLAAPSRLVFTLQPGRIEMRLPDGRSHAIAIGWMKEGTPIFGHFFAHPAAAHLPARFALTGVEIAFGTPGSSAGDAAAPAHAESLVDGATVSIARSRFAPSEKIEIAFTVPAGLPANAWMGIVPAAVEHGDQGRNDQHDITYQYLSGRAAATLTFGPFGPGEWTARVNANGREYAWAAFTVAPDVVPPGQNRPSLAVDRTRFAPSERIPVKFTAPTAYPGNAWIGIIPASIDHGDQARNDQHDITYQYVSGRADGTMEFGPFGPGEWTARLNAFGIETASVAFAVAADVVPPGQNPPSLAVPRTRFCPWEKIPVTFTAPTAYPNDAWIGIIPASVEHGDQARNDQHDVTYQYVSGRADGTMEFGPFAPGEWTARINAFGIESGSVAFTIAPEVVPPGQSAPSLRLNKTAFAPGEAVTVTFTAPSAYPTNSWIGVIPAAVDHGSVARNDQSDITYQYLSGRAAGTMTFTAPGPGRWSLRMNTGDGRLESASVDFEVR